MIPIDPDWVILSDLFNSDKKYTQDQYRTECARGKESGEEPSDIWARLKDKTKEWGVEFFKEVRARKYLAHLNSVKNFKDFPYEGAPFTELFNLWSEGIRNLPECIVNRIGSDHYNELKEGFVPYILYNDSETRILERVNQIGQRILRGDLVVLETGFPKISHSNGGHSLYVVFCRGYMLLCNRGYRSDEESKITIRAHRVKIADFQSPAAICFEIGELLSKNDERENLKLLYKTIPKELKVEEPHAGQLHGEESDGEEPDLTRDVICEQLEKLTTGNQKVGNCSSANCKEALLGALALLSLPRGPNDEASITDEALKEAKLVKRAISAHVRATELESYYSKHRASIGGANDCFDRHLARICLRKAKEQLMKAEFDLARYPALEELDQLLWRENPIIGTVLNVRDAFRSVFDLLNSNFMY